jgi:hypothetical protein
VNTAEAPVPYIEPMLLFVRLHEYVMPEGQPAVHDGIAMKA